MKNERKWINIYRENYQQAGIDPSIYTDEEILIMAKSAVAQEIVNELDIEREWVFDLWWNAMLTMDPAQVLNEGEQGSFINMEAFKERVKRNTN